MNNRDIELEFIKRYRYLFLNSKIILAGLSDKGRIKYQDEYLEEEMLRYLVGDSKLQDSQFYLRMEELKHKKVFLDMAGSGYDKVRKMDEGVDSNTWIILRIVRNYIVNNYDKDINRRQWLDTMDEYFRMNRTDRNGRVYVSGYYLEFEDIDTIFRYINNKCRIRDEYYIDKKNTLVGDNIFSSYFSVVDNNGNDKMKGLISYEEVRHVYLSLHDMIGYDIKVYCGDNEEEIDNISDKIRIVNRGGACYKEFNLMEEEIFTDFMGNYYQLCPLCGYITRISEEILSEKIQDRIIDKSRREDILSKKIDEGLIIRKKKKLIR